MKEVIKKYFGSILLLAGIFIATYALLSFSYNRGCLLPGECMNPVVYFYSDEVRLLAAFGLALFVAGLLIIKRK
ncbi:MAG: hypothetical protein A3A80_02985 [Candidatus Terrybacteria bacterium RIFCSPLOWO2_01_FULL_44_24]|uniref:Uncharacterized protein n=1 Tax=Candidatus Terrybacteria bacterium RIFCSPHIGHO2_01_FULL_43_35 TaxID=1802361 RepID=A0A1G2PEX2_9BACT|nr:MAG: hypothetical protein A2828_03170 [Candidatus Terrybacteria bacterium RIFCSPHIGHO2_01_FULL_43_35]OHA51029.1 MAG: hypothetical protein A3A80_02985 [Candidatus Terrybacteria bacterium RIFCSPLOWO2_01_FULL_44_24]